MFIVLPNLNCLSLCPQAPVSDPTRATAAAVADILAAMPPPGLAIGNLSILCKGHSALPVRAGYAWDPAAKRCGPDRSLGAPLGCRVGLRFAQPASSSFLIAAVCVCVGGGN